MSIAHIAASGLQTTTRRTVPVCTRAIAGWATVSLLRSFGTTLNRVSATTPLSKKFTKLPTFNQKRNFITIVQQGTVGFRLTLGKNPTVLKPGLHIYLPGIQTVTNVDMREGCLQIPDLHACTKDNVPVVISGSLFYKVEDPYKSCFAVQEFDASLLNVGTSCLRAVIGTLNYDDIIAARSSINDALRNTIGNTTSNWGAECTKFEIQRFEPQNAQVQRQLELQMEAERRRRQQELDTKGKVNISEGLRQSIILESEGDLQAKKNKADGDYYRQLKESEASKIQMTLEAEGIKAQLDTLTQKFDGDSSKAAQFLLELKRWEALQAVANGPNNATYFLPDSKSLVPMMPFPMGNTTSTSSN